MIILAFPGMGKTPLSRRNAKYLDLDFGYFRSALKVPKEKEETILPQFAALAKSYENDGYVVLSNEPKLMKYAKVGHVYLPKQLSFSAKKMGVDEDTINDWVLGWETIARQYRVPVTYVKVGLDHYLR